MQYLAVDLGHLGGLLRIQNMLVERNLCIQPGLALIERQNNTLLTYQIVSLLSVLFCLCLQRVPGVTYLVRIPLRYRTEGVVVLSFAAMILDLANIHQSIEKPIGRSP